MEVLSEASCGPVRYQWLRDGAALTTELGPVLEVARADQGSEGTYTCRVSVRILATFEFEYSNSTVFTVLYWGNTVCLVI